MHMGKIAMEVSSEFRRVSLLPWLSMHSDEESFRSELSTTGMRSVIDGRVDPMGSPRYVNGMVPISHCQIFASCVASELSKLMGISTDL